MRLENERTHVERGKLIRKVMDWAGQGSAQAHTTRGGAGLSSAQAHTVREGGVSRFQRSGRGWSISAQWAGRVGAGGYGSWAGPLADSHCGAGGEWARLPRVLGSLRHCDGSERERTRLSAEWGGVRPAALLLCACAPLEGGRALQRE